MEDGKSLDTTLGSNSELSHCCRESCNFTFAERKEPSRDVFPQKFSHENGPDFFRVDNLLVVHDTVFRDVGGDFSRFEVGAFSFFKNMSGASRRNQHSSGRSPTAHFIARISRPRNRRLLCPAPAKETMASRGHVGVHWLFYSLFRDLQKPE